MKQILILSLAVILFSVGVLIFFRFAIKTPRPLCLKVVFDANDQKSFLAIMAVISSYDLLSAEYGEEETISYIVIGVSKRDYMPIFRSIQALQNVEVI